MITRVLLAFSAVLTMTGAAQAELSIVATLPDLGAVAKAVGGSHVSVKVLATATEDPHFVDPRPSYLVTLSKADAILHNGLELEIGWLPSLLTGSRNSKIGTGQAGNIDASRFVTKKLGVPTGKVDRAMGDVHPGGNPHFGYGPDQMTDIARGLAAKLAAMDSAHAADFKANAEAFVAELQKLATEQKARFAGLTPAQRKVVVYHDSLVYLVAWLGLDQVATIEDRPGIKPSPGHVGDVLRAIKGGSVKAILQEEFHPDTISGTLGKAGGATIVKLPGGSRETSGKGYLTYLGDVAGKIYDVLSK